MRGTRPKSIHPHFVEKKTMVAFNQQQKQPHATNMWNSSSTLCFIIKASDRVRFASPSLSCWLLHIFLHPYLSPFIPLVATPSQLKRPNYIICPFNIIIIIPAGTKFVLLNKQDQCCPWPIRCCFKGTRGS